MKFDIYGRYVIDLVRAEDNWIAFRLDGNGRRRLHDLVVPPDLPDTDLATYLDDLLHEQSPIGGRVRRLD